MTLADDLRQRGVQVVLVSACLLGVCCRYNRKNAARNDAMALIDRFVCLPICPEQLGGLATPRSAATIESGDGGDVLAGKSRIVNEAGEDVTEAFIRGAEQARRIARQFHAQVAVLKEGSPSCGVDFITRGGERVRGCGVAAVVLRQCGIEVIGIE